METVPRALNLVKKVTEFRFTREKRKKTHLQTVEDREEDEDNGNSPLEDGNSPQGVEFGKEGGGFEVDKREEKEDLPEEDREEDEENGNSPQGVEFG